MAENDRQTDGNPESRQDPACDSVFPSWKENMQDLLAAAAGGFDALEKSIDKLAADFQGRIATLPPARLGACLAEYERLSEKVAQAQTLASIGSMPQHDARLASMAARLTFAADEICNMDETRLLAGMTNPVVAAYAPWLSQVRALKGHRLDAKTEAYLQKKDIVSTSAWARCYDLALDRGVDVGGMPAGFDDAIQVMQREKDPLKRQEVYRAIDQSLQAEEETLARVFNAVAAIRRVSDGWRDYSEAMDRRATADLTDGGMADAFLEKTAASCPSVVHPYFSAKAARGGAVQLHPADIEYPPIAASDAKRYTWQEAQDIVLSAFAGLSKPLAERAQRFFDEGWIDAAPAAGKDAYCLHVAGAHPFLSMSFEGRPEDVLQLARLLGSGIQQEAMARSGHLNATLPAVTDDVVAVFCEMATKRALASGMTDAQERRRFLEAITGALIRDVPGEAAAVSFERDCHAQRRDAGELSAGQINDLWTKSRHAFAGAAMDADEMGARAWMLRDSLFKRPFSTLTPVMSRAFALAIAAHADADALPEGMLQAFDAFLTQKGSRTPLAVAASFGLDGEDPAFWSRSMGVIKRQVDALQALDRQIAAAREGKGRLPANDVSPRKKTRKTVVGKKGPEMP
jgi:oligoendopeptidase F